MLTRELTNLIIFILSFVVFGATSFSSDNKYCLNDVDVGQFTQVGNTSRFYYFSEDKATWFKSFQACRLLGGHLASFDTDEELRQLSHYMAEKYPTTRKWWISAADLNIDGEFHWYGTGKQFDYTSLSFRRPTSWKKVEQCGHLHFINNRYQVNDSKCKDQEFYVCDLDKGRVLNYQEQNQNIV